jgi:hypothetical protein
LLCGGVAVKRRRIGGFAVETPGRAGIPSRALGNA